MRYGTERKAKIAVSAFVVRGLSLGVCAGLLLLLAACPGPPLAETPPSGSVAGRTPAEEPPAREKTSLEEVERAFNSGNMPLTESLASEFTGRADVSKAQLSLGWRFLALAALENRRPTASLTALDRWRLTSPSGEPAEEWLLTWYEAMLQLPAQEAYQRAGAIVDNPARHPEALVREAGLFLLEQRLVPANGREAMRLMDGMYRKEPPARKGQLEKRLFSFLHTLSPAALANLMLFTTDNNENNYPYALVRLENARRLFWDAKTRDTARDNVAFIREGSMLTDLGLFRDWNRPDPAVLKKVRGRTQALALVLPLSGQYGNLSEKIVRGAKIARDGLARVGRFMQIYVIDSDKPDWTSEVSALPSQVRLIGGPLRLADYVEAKGLGFTRERFFFTFLPRMDEADEGLTAWRFFPSREDQIRVMLDYTASLDILDYAVFSPDTGDYNKQMFDLFQAQAAERGVNVVRSGYYPAGKYTQWVKSVSDFLGIPQEKGAEANLDFRAVFLPDNWSNSSRIISHIFYLLENNILFMGTNLWEHGLNTQQRPDPRNTRMSIFPGAWDQKSLSPSGMFLRGAVALENRENADFWFSLGYDFTLMAASLDLPENSGAADLNAALAALPPSLPWSGAPIHWDGRGSARQALFVLTPTENGFTLADREYLRVRLLQPVTPPSPSNLPRLSSDTEPGGDID
ncbi:MAG: hypothetical protein LBQ63_07410 [Deltaproteobacteria bacterium]|jgi:hypothetical protein|nr:hypothetical protein [Deltaproteobacteria bacterium]